MSETEFDKEKIKAFFSGEYSRDDLNYVRDVFSDETNEDELKQLLRKQWYELCNGTNATEKDLNHILYRIHYNINNRIAEKKEKRSFRDVIIWSARIAALLLLPLAIYFFIRLNHPSPAEYLSWVEIKAPAWTRAQFSLPDGTTGWLNSNSSLRYYEDFISNRNVILTGEAYFNVINENNRSFHVSTNEVIVEVLGTRFNISSYENENFVEVVLEEGKLLFNDRELKNPYTMSPNDLVKFDKTLKGFTKETVQPQKYMSWIDGKLIFRNDPIDVIARRLERWYNIEVIIDGKFSDDHRLRATFVDESLEEVLGLLKRGLPLKYRIENRDLKSDEMYSKTRVIISPDKNNLN
ncbi:MAG: FecR family protein [Bacteroidales bacterium]|jgi:ferric-dicitrate binding protein FerR (iron transport regulator)|nr:FecR family protein [Bacteroidales bacterium]